MAVARPAPVRDAEEISEREFQATKNDLQARTDAEVFDAAKPEGFDEDLDGEEEDDGLTNMPEGPLDDEVQDEVDAAEGEEPDDDDADDEDGEEPELEEGDEDDDEQDDPRSQRGRQEQVNGRVPPGRLREEANARRAAENEASELRRQMAEMNGRMAELSARVNAPPQQKAEPKPKPDMFSEPDKYEAWVLEQAEARALEKMDQRFQSFEQRQQQQSIQRVDNALAEAASGPRSFEFSAAYSALTSLDPKDPRNRAVVGRIFGAGENAETALWDWWERNGGPEYREQILDQLSPRQRRQQEREDDRGGRNERVFRDDRGREVRHVVRPGQRLPSLNSASGSMRSRGQAVDPEMSDGSEESIARYAFRR